MDALKFWRVQQHIENRGNTTIALVCKLIGINRRTAKKYLDIMVANGSVVSDVYNYRSNVKVTIYFKVRGVENETN